MEMTTTKAFTQTSLTRMIEQNHSQSQEHRIMAPQLGEDGGTLVDACLEPA
jgi:hypothetical protein